MKHSNIESKVQGSPSKKFHVATQIEKDKYTLIEQPAHLVLLKISIY